MPNASTNLLVESEELLYPVESLLAEFGGTLALFLGFSFMALWDGLTQVGQVIRKFKCKQSQDHTPEDCSKCVYRQEFSVSKPLPSLLLIISRPWRNQGLLYKHRRH